MIKAVIEYKDGTKIAVKKKSYIELADYMEQEMEKGAIGCEAKTESGNTVKSREYALMRRAG